MRKMKPLTESSLFYMESTEDTASTGDTRKIYVENDNIIIECGFGYPELHVEYRRTNKK